MSPPVILFLALGAAGASGPEGSASVEPASPSAQTRPLEWMALPSVDYDADEKLGVGVTVQIHELGESLPYLQSLIARAYVTTAGVQQYRLVYDAPRFLGGPVRLWLAATYGVDLYSPYYGLGNRSSSKLEDHPAAHGARAFQWARRSPYGRAGAALPLGAGAYAFGYLSFREVSVDLYPGSLLGAERPYGVEGGRFLEGTLGMYLDGRDNEVKPSRGLYLEGSVRAAGAVSPGAFGGANACAKYFLSPSKRLTLASRLEVDWLSPKAPFFELSQFGGVSVFDGIGGQYTARGLPRDRYIGRLKAIGTAEARVHLVDLRLLGEVFGVGATAFVDGGRVWQLDGSDDRGLGLHVAWGGGIRIWRRAQVLRLDIGTSRERSLGVYAMAGHFF